MWFSSWLVIQSQRTGVRLAATARGDSANGSDHESHPAVYCTLCTRVINKGGRTVNTNYYADFKERRICVFGFCFVCLLAPSQDKAFSLTLKLAREV